MSKLSLWTMVCLVSALCALAVIGSPSDTFMTLVSFNFTNGANPHGILAQGRNGNLYGTTQMGGANNSGTVFEITTGGKLTTLYSFCSQPDCSDGATPFAGLVQGTDGNFYGTTGGGGGGYHTGTVFKITPAGTLTTLYSFCPPPAAFCADGAGPKAGLVQGTDGNFYGTTTGGGTGSGGGTVFKITTGGKLTTLYSFCSQSGCSDGQEPQAGPVQGANGNFYGTTHGGGAGPCPDDPIIGCGTVFEITPAGKLTTLHSFDGTDGEHPEAGLVQGSDGNFYGTTAFGGTGLQGNVFEITPGGKLTTLYSFCLNPDPNTGACTDGQNPVGGLVQATNRNFYGTTPQGGSNTCTAGPVTFACGTIFEITPGGKLTTLHSFGGTDGENPMVGLVQATNGNFYGTTYFGGSSTSSTCNDSGGCGTVFSLAVGPGPTRTPTKTPTATHTPTPKSATATPTRKPTPTATSVPAPIIGSVPSTILVGASFNITGSHFSAVPKVNFFVATSSGPDNAGPLTPSFTSAGLLTVPVPATIQLGQGFVAVQVVNTDQGFKASNLASALLQGSAGAGIPTLKSINGVGLAPTSSDPSFATNNVQTVIVQSTSVKIGGAGFDASQGVAVNVFCACTGGKVGPLFVSPGAGLTSTSFSVKLPASVPTGPASLVVINKGGDGSYAKSSNAVSVVVGHTITVTSVSQNASTITVNGTGFSTLTVINFFNTQAGKVVNLGGLKPGGGARIPLTVVNSIKFTFIKPAGSVAGPAYVQALNPPFVPYTSSGNDPGGAFMLK